MTNYSVVISNPFHEEVDTLQTKCCIESFVSIPAFQKLPGRSHRLMRILEHLTLLSPGDLIPYAEALTASMALLLEPAVPRRVLQTLNKLWMGLNTVMPRRYMGHR